MSVILGPTAVSVIVVVVVVGEEWIRVSLLVLAADAAEGDGFLGCAAHGLVVPESGEEGVVGFEVLAGVGSDGSDGGLVVFRDGSGDGDGDGGQCSLLSLVLLFQGKGLVVCE